MTPEREAEIRRDFAAERPLLHVACGDTVRELLAEIDRLRGALGSALRKLSTILQEREK